MDVSCGCPWQPANRWSPLLWCGCPWVINLSLEPSQAIAPCLEMWGVLIATFEFVSQLGFVHGFQGNQHLDAQWKCVIVSYMVPFSHDRCLCGVKL